MGPAHKQDLTWYCLIASSWQVASHITHCRQSRYDTEEFKSAFPSDLQSALQNSGRSEARDSCPVICRTAEQEKAEQIRTESYEQTHDRMCGIQHLHRQHLEAVLLSSQTVCLPRCVACVRRSSASENWDWAAEHKPALHTTVSSSCA